MKNRFGKCFLFTLLRCAFRQIGAWVCVVQHHRCDLFKEFNFIINYGGAMGAWTHSGVIFHEISSASIY
jgi:hypothetical protein